MADGESVTDQPDAPLEAASDVIQRVYALLLDARKTRSRLEGMQPWDRSSQAERDLYLGMVMAFEAGLQRTMEEALVMMKQIKGAAAEAWLRRQVDEARQWIKEADRL